MKKIIISLSIVSLISVSILGLILLNNRNKNELTMNDENKNEIVESNNSIEEEEILDENITEDIENKSSGVEDNNSSIYNSNKNDMEINSASNSNVINNKKKENKTSTQVVSKSSEENKVEVKENNNEENTSVNNEEPKKKTPWEALGVSEYHYYNEPMYSWERVDFPVSKYGSEANCRKACAEYGDNYEPYLNGEVLYSCSIVTSLSGKYLGEYFSTEKLN